MAKFKDMRMATSFCTPMAPNQLGCRWYGTDRFRDFFPFFFHELTKEINFFHGLYVINSLTDCLSRLMASHLEQPIIGPPYSPGAPLFFYDLTLFFFLHDLGYEFTITHFDPLLSVWITFLALPWTVSAHQQVYLFSSDYHPFWVTFARFYQPITF